MKQKTLITILAIALITALLAIFGILFARNGGDGSDAMEETAVSPTADPAYAALAGTYRFHAARDAITADYFFTLNPDGTAELSEQPVGDGTTAATATGQWTVDGDAVIFTFSQLDGQPIDPNAIIRVTFIDGFPVIDSITVNNAFVHLQENSFTLGAGDDNGLVEKLNGRLAAIPYLNFTPPNSTIYGEETRQAVVTFQEINGLIPTGVVDTQTWIMLGAPPPLPPTPTAAPITDVPDLSTLPTHDENGSPILYLTFDDGPQPGSTVQLLDVFDQYDAKVTFFNIGINVEAYPDLVREYVSRGHYAANHTWTHNSLEGISKEQFIDEVNRTNEAIIAAAGDLFSLDGSVRYVRPPYGAANAETYAYAAEDGMAVTLWTIDPQDWRRPGVEEIANHIVTNAYPGAIILSHDGGGDRSQTVAAYASALPQLQAEGYVFYTILGAK